MQSAPVTLFKGDDLIVKGRFYQVQGFDQNDGELVLNESEEATLHCVEFDFTVRVNGRLCNFTESFSLCKQFGEPSVYEWSNWYLIVRILKSFGYDFGSRDFTESETSTMKEWIREILNSIPEDIKLPDVEKEKPKEIFV